MSIRKADSKSQRADIFTKSFSNKMWQIVRRNINIFTPEERESLCAGVVPWDTQIGNENVQVPYLEAPGPWYSVEEMGTLAVPEEPEWADVQRGTVDEVALTTYSSVLAASAAQGPGLGVSPPQFSPEPMRNGINSWNHETLPLRTVCAEGDASAVRVEPDAPWPAEARHHNYSMKTRMQTAEETWGWMCQSRSDTLGHRNGDIQLSRFGEDEVGSIKSTMGTNKACWAPERIACPVQERYQLSVHKFFWQYLFEFVARTTSEHVFLLYQTRECV